MPEENWKKKLLFSLKVVFVKNKKTPTLEFLRLSSTLKARFNQPFPCSVLLCKPLINWFSLLLTHVTNEWRDGHLNQGIGEKIILSEKLNWKSNFTVKRQGYKLGTDHYTNALWQLLVVGLKFYFYAIISDQNEKSYGIFFFWGRKLIMIHVSLWRKAQREYPKVKQNTQRQQQRTIMLIGGQILKH